MNINELKSKLAGLNARTKKANDIWKPKDEHDVRLIRDPKSDDPLQTLAFHNNVGDVWQILCPKVNFGDECAICDFADTLRSWKDEKGRDKPEKQRKEEWEIFKKIQAQARVFVPMIERGVNETEPKWWGLTKNQAEQVLKVCEDADRLRECGVDPTDAEKALDAVFSATKAFDLHVSYRKPNEKGNTKSFTQVDVTPKYKPSALTGNKAKDAELVKAIKPLSEVFPKVPSSEAEKTLRKFIGEGMQTAKAEGGDEKYAKQPTNSGETTKKTGGRSIDDAFADLAGEPK